MGRGQSTGVTKMAHCTDLCFNEEMPFPVRCFTCGKVLDPLWPVYQAQLETKKSGLVILDEMKIRRLCCRRMFLTHVDIDDILLLYDVPDV